MNRLSFNDNQLGRISAMTERQKKVLAFVSSALVIDSLYIFKTGREHPLAELYSEIADSLTGSVKTLENKNITSAEYFYLCGTLGLMELDKIIDFIVEKF